MLTVLEIIKRSTDFLAAKGIESPRLSAELLIGHALGRKRMQLYLEFERPLTEAELALIRPLVKRRSLHEPLQYIVGETEFGGVKLKVDRRVLIPRPETELLVELVLTWCRAHGPVARIMDLGTGSGAIALALAHALPDAQVVAVERNQEALTAACENFAAAPAGARVTTVASDWYADLRPLTCDVIVSNPPYLSEEEVAATQPEVHRYEPVAALAASDGGFGDLAKIIAGASRFLRRGGLLALETGIAQHPRILDAVRTAGFSHADSQRDLTGRDRFILAVF
jgi:release factor glutamine methyltransferase